MTYLGQFIDVTVQIGEVTEASGQPQDLALILKELFQEVWLGVHSVVVLALIILSGGLILVQLVDVPFFIPRQVVSSWNVLNFPDGCNHL